MTEQINYGELFYTEAAGKHLVALICRATAPAKPTAEATTHVFTAFVIEAAGQWFLITAGHVINGIKDAQAAGYLVDWFRLGDKAAGSKWDFGVPIPFEIAEWVVLEGDPGGTDYAAWPIPDLIVQQLRAGGVKALGEHTWLEPIHEAERPHWVLAGIPKENVITRGSKIAFRGVLIPLIPTAAPPEATTVERRTFAQIKPPDDPSSVTTTDIDGMSGGPIFAVRMENHPEEIKVNYGVIGIQSGWLAPQRIISFCSLAEFAEGVKRAVEIVRSTNATDANNDQEKRLSPQWP